MKELLGSERIRWIMILLILLCSEAIVADEPTEAEVRADVEVMVLLWAPGCGFHDYNFEVYNNSDDHEYLIKRTGKSATLGGPGECCEGGNCECTLTDRCGYDFDDGDGITLEIDDCTYANPVTPPFPNCNYEEFCDCDNLQQCNGVCKEDESTWCDADEDCGEDGPCIFSNDDVKKCYSAGNAPYARCIDQNDCSSGVCTTLPGTFCADIPDAEVVAIKYKHELDAEWTVFEDPVVICEDLNTAQVPVFPGRKPPYCDFLSQCIQGVESLPDPGCNWH